MMKFKTSYLHYVVDIGAIVLFFSLSFLILYRTYQLSKEIHKHRMQYKQLDRQLQEAKDSYEKIQTPPPIVKKQGQS